MELDFETADSEDAGGYAKAQSEDQNEQQQRLLTPHLAGSDVIITTAAIPGMASPRADHGTDGRCDGTGHGDRRPGAERGGNCALTDPDAEVRHGGVLILGPTDLASRSPQTASQMFASNVVTLLRHLADDEGTLVIDAEDEVASAMLVAADGEVVHPRLVTASPGEG